MSDYQLSVASGIPKSTISKLMNSKTKFPGYETLNAIAKVLEIDVKLLLEKIPSRHGHESLKPEEPAGIYRTIPVFSFENANYFDPNQFEKMQKKAIGFSDTKIKGKAVFAVKTEADQWPFLEGQHLIIQPEAEPKNGDYVLTRTASKIAKIGRYWSIHHRAIIKCLDTQKETWALSVQDNLEEVLIGVVKQVIWEL